MRNGNRTRDMQTARQREAEYAALEPSFRATTSFGKWLRGKFGVTVGQRLRGDKPTEAKVGATYTRVQHRTGPAPRRRS